MIIFRYTIYYNISLSLLLYQVHLLRLPHTNPLAPPVARRDAIFYLRIAQLECGKRCCRSLQSREGVHGRVRGRGMCGFEGCWGPLSPRLICFLSVLFCNANARNADIEEWTLTWTGWCWYYWPDIHPMYNKIVCSTCKHLADEHTNY